MGRVKAAAAVKMETAKGKAKGKAKAKGEGKEKEKGQGSELNDAVRALGGDDADLELVAGVDSDDVGGGGEDIDPKLAQDIAKFMKKLDFGKMKRDADIASEDDKDDTDDAAGGDELQTRALPDVRAAPATAASNVADSTRAPSKFTVAPVAQWYLAAPPLPPAGRLPAPSPEFLSSTFSRAAQLHEHDTSLYAASDAHTSSASDARFLTRVLASGTLSDKLSALTLMAQASPVHNVRALDALKAMASKKGREESLKALRAIVDWWVGGGAPARKLKYFRDQDIKHPDVSPQHLILWYFEDWLKKYFFGILQLLETLAADPLPYVRTQALHLILQLLREKPEQEQNLLRLLVHKLGDAEKAVASKASYALLQLLQPHPQMKGIIVHEVSALILKPATAPVATSKKTAPTKEAPVPQTPEGKLHAKYYAVITFNQIVLLPSDKDVAARLVDAYFAIFREILGEDQKRASEEDAAGVQEQARDFTPKKRRGFQGKQKPVHSAKKKKKGGPAFEEVPDANAKLISQILTGVNRALPFAKTEDSAFDAHIDTLFLITHTAPFPTALQALTLLSHIPRVADRFYRALYASLVDVRLAGSAKQAMYLNLLFRVVKEDANPARVAAFVRRFLQVLGSTCSGPAFVCGGLFLLDELFETKEEVRAMMDVPRTEQAPQNTYDARKRDAQYAHASASCLWEIIPLLHHYHPSVSLHARQLLTRTRVTATADLGLNTLTHFLDRFVYRNARKVKPRGASAMQPGEGGAGVRAGRAGEKEGAVNERGWGGDVPADQVFFERYFTRKKEREAERQVKASKRKGKGGEDGDADGDSYLEGVEEGGEGGEEEGSDADEAEIWKAMKSSVPELVESDVDVDDDSIGDIPEVGGDDEDAGLDDNPDDDDDGSDADFFEDSDDLLSDTADPHGLLEYEGSPSEDGGEEENVENREWQGFSSRPQKRGRTDEEGGKEVKRKKRRELPTFASYEDYAGMIEQGAENNL